MDEYPDSVLQLLNIQPEEIEDFSDKECARYALLLARATDKCEQSLLPCDSLLNIALEYYDDEEKERAVALLYKGRLEVEMNSTEDAIVHLQEGLTILTNFPKEIETRRITLSTLGNLYYKAKYYEEAMKIYRDLYKHCTTDKDKFIALYAMSSYYCMTNKEDSTIITQQKALKYKPEEYIIVGNVALYGATSGEAYINGIAGERFCVRNSGAYAVVEGVGEHGCEYMTGGRVVVLGATGKNFAAGMSGGIAYVLDEKSNLYRNLNKEMISIELVESKFDIAELKNMIEKHVAHTGSEKGKEILTHFDEYLPKFKKIIPNDYKRMMMLSAQMEDKGLSSEQAQIEAFYESMRK